jgi:hypothetical protein
MCTYTPSSLVMKGVGAEVKNKAEKCIGSLHMKQFVLEEVEFFLLRLIILCE